MSAMTTHAASASSRAWSLATLAAACLTLAIATGCATSPHAVGAAATDEPALILATDTYELHYRDGRVVVLDSRPDRVVGPRDVANYAEFRELYEARAAERLPEHVPGDGLEVSGWRGLECVRRGHACGREPEWPARDMVRLRLRFPEPSR